jgi:hypothetical protein
VPFVLIQVLMIALTLAFPGMVMRYKAGEVHQDINKIKLDLPNLGGGLGLNPFAAPGAGGGSSPGLQGTPPGLGGTPTTPGGSGAPKPAAQPPATDLSQPPKFN